MEDERRGVNPFFIGAEFLEYCVRRGLLEFVLDEQKRVHYYITEQGRKTLSEDFGINLQKPCAYEKTDP